MKSIQERKPAGHNSEKKPRYLRAEALRFIIADYNRNAIGEAQPRLVVSFTWCLSQREALRFSVTAIEYLMIQFVTQAGFRDSVNSLSCSITVAGQRWNGRH